MKRIKSISTTSKSFSTICRLTFLSMSCAVLTVTAAFGLQLNGVTPAANSVDALDIAKAGSAKQPSSGNVVSTVGVFSASASSPVELTCVTSDPTTGYVYAQQNNGTEFYRYLPFSDTWVQLASSPLSSGNNGGGAYVNGKIYTTYTNQSELGIYTIADDSWTTITSPLPDTGNITSDGNELYLAVDDSLIRYDPATDTSTTLASPTVSFQRWGGLSIFNGFIYGHSGNGMSGFSKYDIANDEWTALADIPDGAVLGCAIDPVGRVYYAYGNYGGSTWYAFDLVSETWSTIAFPLYAQLDDGGMVYVSGTGIYMTFGEGSTGFGRIVLTTPTTVSSIVRSGASPASGPSASWTVTFNDPVSNVNAGNFALVNTSLGGTPVVTGVTPIGSTPATQWTITANAGLGSGSLGLDMITDTAVSNQITNLPFIGEVYTFNRTGPTAANDYYTVNQDAVLTVSAAAGVLLNDSDPNNDPITAVLVSGPTFGGLTLSPDGSFTYTPTMGYDAEDSFTYHANDGTANSRDVTVTILVGEHPVMAYSSAMFSGPEGTSATVTVTRTGDISGTSSVEYATADDTAHSGTCGSGGAHYEAASGTLTFDAAETVKTFDLTLCPNSMSEDPAETVTLNLSNPTGGFIGAQSGSELMVLDAATSFKSAIPMIIEPGTTSFPYGTTVNVTGMPETMGGLRVTLYGVTHPDPDSLQVLLVSPGGSGFVLMAHTGGNTPLFNSTITFEDTAPIYLPAVQPIVDGLNYRPANCGLVNTFPSPAPTEYTKPGCGPSGPAFSGTFAARVLNGSWVLYVQDTRAPGVVASPGASISGWGFQPMLVTAAEASLSGHVLTKSGSGIRNAMVTVAGGNLAQPKTIISTTFGYYNVKGLTAGQAYVISVTAKKYTFTQSVRAVQLLDDTTGFDFVADR